MTSIFESDTAYQCCAYTLASFRVSLHHNYDKNKETIVGSSFTSFVLKQDVRMLSVVESVSLHRKRSHFSFTEDFATASLRPAPSQCKSELILEHQ